MTESPRYLATEPATEPWSSSDAVELYDVDRWGKGYFSVSERGHLLVHPDQDPARAIDLKDLVDQIILRGISPPLLLRFSGILEHRLASLHDAFQSAIVDHGFRGEYRCVYPIKVNQQREVVEDVFRFGRQYGYGLEAGSKAELLAVLAIADNETPIVCNGFKDDEYIEMVMLAKKVGRNIIPIVEKYSELGLIAKHSRRLQVKPRIGLRVKLASRGSGHWSDSAGYRSKFGLTLAQAAAAIEELRALNLTESVELLHFHLGSQITNIRQIKAGVTEAARIYVELAQAGAGMKFLNVGGGLGVDYDGSQSDFESSVNYTLQEYANDIIYYVRNVCDEAGIEHPTIFSESGRAVVAYHSALVFNVLGVSGPGAGDLEPEPSSENAQPLVDLRLTYDSLEPDNLIESFHDAQQAFDEALHLFSLGYLPLAGRAEAEDLYWAICRRVLKRSAELEFVPEELQGLESMLADTYFCNFSVFQSLPDAWAIDQLFPVLPLHRLDERPERPAILGDISCDSDGKLDHFIDRASVKHTLPLHPFGEEPYYLGAFLVGAYQEILGDMHNLLGDTNAVNVSLDEKGEVVLDHVTKGDTVRDMLAYVQFSADQLLAAFRRDVESAVRAGNIGYEESGRLLRSYEDGLNGYTYLEPPHEG